MYVLVHKERVLAGPMGWNRAIFEGNLKKLNISFGLSREAPNNLPLTIDENTKIYEAILEYPEHNKKIEYPHGPFWKFTNIATGTFKLLPIHVDLIKGTLKEIVSKNRYEKEISGVEVTIQNKNIKFDTARDRRIIFVEKLISMADSSTINWKHENQFLALTKNDVHTIVNRINEHVQNAFDWELNKIQEIDSKTTAQELDAIDLT
jgi:ligand-binding SRPBCC domain-containing protein